MNASDGCRPELLCNNLFCGRPCKLDTPATCPRGYVCRDGLNGPSCLPSCEESGCSEGKACVRIQHRDISFCAEVVGENCQAKQCPQGRECNVVYTMRSEKVAMACALPCKDDSGCPTGFICSWGAYCERRCFPGLPDSCEPGTGCSQANPERTLYACSPNPSAH